MLKLDFVEPYLSVRGLEAPELPKLSFITGANGSGKSHLLLLELV